MAMTDADAQSQENEVDAALKRAMPEGFAAMMRLRAVKAGQPGIAPAPEPDLTVTLIGPDAMKRSEDREAAMASLASLAYAAAVVSYQNGLAAKTPALADAFLSQGAKQSLTVAALVQGLDGLGRTRPAPAKKANGKRDRKDYMRAFMRRRSALAKAEPSPLDA